MKNNLSNSGLFSYYNGFEENEHVLSVPVFIGSMNEFPKVSIMIPTYRRVCLLKEAIESALNQKTSIPYEVVVVNNDHLDSHDFNNMIKEFNSQKLSVYQNSENIGMFGNWNRCIELARSEWVSILNDDDILFLNFIEETMNCLQGREMIGCNVISFTNINTTLKARGNNASAKNKIVKINILDILYGIPVHSSLGVIINKETAISLGGYNRLDYPCSDYTFIIKYWLNNGVRKINKTLAAYRWCDNESLKTGTKDIFKNKEISIKNEILYSLNCNYYYKKVIAYMAISRCTISQMILDYRCKMIQKKITRIQQYYYVILRCLDKVIRLTFILLSAITFKLHAR